MATKVMNSTTFADSDPTDMLIQGSLSDFLLMRASEIGYMCMFAYTFLHGCKLFKTLKEEQALSYKFVRMIFQCTGGGILVPLLINAIPVSLGNDAYPIAIFASFLLHQYFPILREVVNFSVPAKAALIVMYETQRASVVFKLTTAAATMIPASTFLIPIFGPIFCGGIGGCGGAFLPMDKGLSAIENGLAPNMTSALAAATFIHLFLNTSASDGVSDAKAKTQILVAYGFILHSLITEIGISKLLGLEGKPVSVVKEASSEPVVKAPVAEAAPTKSKKSKKAKKVE